MNNIDRQYKELLDYILHFGVEKKDRTGTGTKSIFGWQIRHNMKEGFPLLTTKKMAWKSIVTELLWFLRGDTNIKFLLENECHIWTGDAYKRYRENKTIFNHYIKGGDVADVKQFEDLILQNKEFADEWGDLGPIYGKQWRRWTQYEIDMPGFDAHFNETQTDQIQNLINELKTNPDSRRLMVSAWNVGELDQMVLPPCHYGFQVYTRELSLKEKHSMVSRITDKMTPNDLEGKEWIVVDNKPYKIPTRSISLMWNQRSVDTFLGLPFNIASYGLLLEIIAKEVNMLPEELIGNLGDTHLYLNHIEQAKEQISRTPYELPKLTFDDSFENISWFLNHPRKDNNGNKQPNYNEFFKQLKPEWFIIENYQSHPTIKAPLNN